MSYCKSVWNVIAKDNKIEEKLHAYVCTQKIIHELI